jgi:hypothetical protein
MKPTAASLIRSILITGFIAGTLDILAAWLVFGFIAGNTTMLRLLQYIASAVLGTESYGGGTTTAVYGLLFHYCIAMSFTAAFYLLWRIIPFLLKHKVAAGLIYGVMVWCIMNLIVVPNSKIPSRGFQLETALWNIGILMLCIGLPISLMAYRYYAGRLQKTAKASS